MRLAPLLLLAACTGPAGPAGPGGPPGTSPDAGPTPPVIGTVDRLELPPEAPYPISIASSADGSLFVASAPGPIAKFVPTSTRADVIVPQVGDAGTIVANVMVDGDTLYACGDLFHGTADNPFAAPTATLFAFDLAGQPKASYLLPHQGSSLCEDIAVGPDHTVYVTDPFDGEIDKVGATLDTWLADPALLANTSIPVPPFGAHGIAVTSTDVYVSNFSTSTLARVPIAAGGSAGALVPQTAPVTNPERLVAVDGDHLLVSEDVWCGPGRLTALARTGDSWAPTVLASHLLGATSVAEANASYYAVESQVCGLIGQLAGGPPADPILPFWIDRIAQ